MVEALQPEDDAAPRRCDIVRRLQEVVERVVPGGELRLYDSSSCGLNAKGADIDPTLERPGPPPSHEEQKAIVRELGGMLSTRQSWESVEAIPASRLAIVKNKKKVAT